MTTQADRFRYLPLLIAGVAVVLFSTAGIGRIAGLFSVPTGDSSGLVAFAGVPAAAAEVIEGAAQTVPQPPIGAIGAKDAKDAKSAKGGGRGKGRCANCGVIVSVVETARNAADRGTIETARVATGHPIETSMNLTPRVSITIRMADGSIHTIDEASPANWRLGEQVILIAGANPAK